MKAKNAMEIQKLEESEVKRNEVDSRYAEKQRFTLEMMFKFSLLSYTLRRGVVFMNLGPTFR